MGLLPADVQKQINSQLDRELGSRVRKDIRTQFEIIKSKMISDFNNHPVTREIDAGPDSSNISETLNGYGNLFSFIGFAEGQDPLIEVRRELNQVLIKNISYKNGKWDFIIQNEPTREKLFLLTPIPWSPGRSWMDGIETGLSGLGLYLYAPEKDFGEESNSGTAIQLKAKKKSKKAFGDSSTGGAVKQQRSRYKRTSYISAILKEFRYSISKLRNIK